MSGYRTIKRGRMAGDRFTQIANRVFRDPRLSGKAMGVFGHLSTHRAGYGVTPERISQFMRDGVSAIKGALQELEACGYLYRERERRPDGTLGASTYYITDQPDGADDASGPADQPAEPCEPQPGPGAGETSRSEPEVGNPPVDCPAVENPPLKKTKGKKTTSKKTNPVLPSVPRERAATASRRGGTDGPTVRKASGSRAGASHRVEAVPDTPGVQLLLQLGAADPRYLLTGPALRDQGVVVSALLAAGWTAQQVRQVVLGRPLPEKITTSVGAIVAQRLGQALASPVPAAPGSSLRATADPTWTPPPVAEVLDAVPPRVECDGHDGLCGRPVVPGHDQCTACLESSRRHRATGVGS